MTAVKDDYIKDTIKKGDEGSKLLNALCAPTLKNSGEVDIIEHWTGRSAAIRVPDRWHAVVHSAGGDPEEEGLGAHASSMVEKLVRQALSIGARPIAFANVIDSSEGESSMLEEIAGSMVRAADRYGIAIINGENAILGERINCGANVSGTMISIVPREGTSKTLAFDYKGAMYAIFDPEGKLVLINSDGVGTKTEFYERAGRYAPAVNDFMAMNLDDAVKLGAVAKVISGVVETKGDIPFDGIQSHASILAGSMGLTAIMHHEAVGGRLMGHDENAPSYNISGSVVSVIDEERLKQLRPDKGEYLIAIRSRRPNPRSNGITDKRKTMKKFFGERWHKTTGGKIFMEYLAEPSTILYPVFKELIHEGLATSVYHMSGGSYDGKLARPMARHNLFAYIDNLFLPDWRELAIGGMSLTPAETAYAKWPMGNEGFVTTDNPGAAIRIIERYGLEARGAGVLQEAREKAGVEIKAFNGETVYFSGK